MADRACRRPRHRPLLGPFSVRRCVGTTAKQASLLRPRARLCCFPSLPPCEAGRVSFWTPAIEVQAMAEGAAGLPSKGMGRCPAQEPAVCVLDCHLVFDLLCPEEASRLRPCPPCSFARWPAPHSLPLGEQLLADLWAAVQGCAALLSSSPVSWGNSACTAHLWDRAPHPRAEQKPRTHGHSGQPLSGLGGTRRPG